MAFLQVPEDVGFSVLPPGDMHVYTSVVPGSDGATDCEGTAGAVTAGLLGAAIGGGVNTIGNFSNRCKSIENLGFLTDLS